MPWAALQYLAERGAVIVAVVIGVEALTFSIRSDDANCPAFGHERFRNLARVTIVNSVTCVGT